MNEVSPPTPIVMGSRGAGAVVVGAVVVGRVVGVLTGALVTVLLAETSFVETALLELESSSTTASGAFPVQLAAMSSGANSQNKLGREESSNDWGRGTSRS